MVVDVEAVVVDVEAMETQQVTEIAVSDRPFSYPNVLVLPIGRRPLLPGIIHPFMVLPCVSVIRSFAMSCMYHPYCTVRLMSSLDMHMLHMLSSVDILLSYKGNEEQGPKFE